MPTSRSPFDRPRWNEADARAVIAALERSGPPVAVFAASHGLDPQRVYLWRRRLAGGERTTFLEVVVHPSIAMQPIDAARGSASDRRKNLSTGWTDSKCRASHRAKYV